MTDLNHPDAKGLLWYWERWSDYPFSRRWHDRPYGFAAAPTPAGRTS
jgi:hypothetical protein